MSRVSYHSVPQSKLPLSFARRWGASLGIWGAGAGFMALYLLSVTPIVRRDVLSKVPAVGWYWQDNTPASDKPF